MASAYAGSDVQEIIGMGFSQSWAEYALTEANGDSAAALEFIFDHTDEMDDLILTKRGTSCEPTGANDLDSLHEAVEQPISDQSLTSSPAAVVVSSAESETPTPSTKGDEGPEMPSGTASFNPSPQEEPDCEQQVPLGDNTGFALSLNSCDFLPPVPSTAQSSPAGLIDTPYPLVLTLPSVPVPSTTVGLISALASGTLETEVTVASADSAADSGIQRSRTVDGDAPVDDAASNAAATVMPVAQTGEWVCMACTYINPAPDIADESSSSSSGGSGGVCAMCSAGQGATFSAAQAAEALTAEAAGGYYGAAEFGEGGGGAYQVEDEAAARQREEEDRVLAEQLAEPRVECVVCMDDVPISDAFTLDCAASHRYCFPCVRRQVTLSSAEKKVAACLLCNHAITQLEVRQLFGDHSSELAAHLDAEIGNVLASNNDLWIGCPQPNCQAFAEATTPGVPEYCRCPTCGYAFCSRCKELFHGVPLAAASPDSSNGKSSSNGGGGSGASTSGITFADSAAAAAVTDTSLDSFLSGNSASGGGSSSNRGGGLTCGEAAETARRWHSWRNGGRSAFIAKRTVNLNVAQKKFDDATQNAMRRFADLEADETWKEENCRLCPHCSKPIFKVDGCNSVTCGRDASDKGGGNRQDGCGKTLDWKTAVPYKRSGADKARLPKTLADVDPERAREVKHHVYVDDFAPLSGVEGDLPQMERQTTSEYRIKCEVCLSDIIGPRFTCAHCPGKFECCLDCSHDDAKLVAAKPSHDPATHAFQIFFEDVSAIGEGVDPTSEPSSRGNANEDDSESSGGGGGDSSVVAGLGLPSRLRNLRDAAENALLGNQPDARRDNNPSGPCNPS